MARGRACPTCGSPVAEIPPVAHDGLTSPCTRGAAVEEGHVRVVRQYRCRRADLTGREGSRRCRAGWIRPWVGRWRCSSARDGDAFGAAYLVARLSLGGGERHRECTRRTKRVLGVPALVPTCIPEIPLITRYGEDVGGVGQVTGDLCCSEEDQLVARIKSTESARR